MLEKITFTKDESFKTDLETLNKMIEESNLTTEQKENLNRDVIGGLVIPKNFMILDVIIDKYDIEDKIYHGLAFIIECLETGEKQNVSVARFFDLGLLKGLIQFKPSRQKSNLKGAGILNGTESISPDINTFCSKYGLNRKEAYLALKGRKFKATKIEGVVTYFPPTQTDRKSAEELNRMHKEKEFIPGLKTGYKYRFTFIAE